MVLKEYINFEHNISNNLFNINSYEIKPGEKTEFDESVFDSFYILFNIGHLLQLTIDNEQVFCPAKDCLFGCHRHPQFLINENNYYKFIIITLNGNFDSEIKNKVINAVDAPFNKIFAKNDYCFSFSFNIEIIELLESLYKSCGDDMSAVSNFLYLELESKFLHFLSAILKIILFEDHKFNGITATPDIKFYIIVKRVVNNKEKLDDLLKKFNGKKENFDRLYIKYFR